MSTLRAFTMPKWGIEMTEGVIAEWAVADGEAFVRGQLLASVETDKIVNEIEADYDAVCLRRVAAEGETLAVGGLLAVFGSADAAAGEIDAFIAAFSPVDTSLAGDDDGSVTATAATTPATDTVPAIPDGVRISPLAARAAGTMEVDIGSLAGSGRNGRIQLQDVERAAMAGDLKTRPPVDNAVRLGEFPGVAATDVARRVAVAGGIDLAQFAGTGSGKDGRIRVRDLTPDDATGGVVRTPFSAMRAKIAQRLCASYRDIPHYYLEIEVSVDALLETRAAHNGGGAQRASLNDFIVRAVAKTLRDHPQVNAHVGDNEVLSFPSANVAIAVAIADGLITPVVRNADDISFAELCERSAQLVARARAGTLTLDDLSAGTFTVSNLGMFGVTRFTALINPPQAAILAVGAVRRVPVESAGNIAFGQAMTLTLGCDHRVIDGAVGGRFLADLKTRIEAPQSLPD